MQTTEKTNERKCSVYVAHNFAARLSGELQAEVAVLRDLGFRVTATWLNVPADSNTVDKRDHATNRMYAIKDWSDLISADVLLYYADDHSDAVGRGKHVELGAAIAQAKAGHKTVIAISEGYTVKHVFLTMPEVMIVKDFSQAVTTLLGVRASLASRGLVSPWPGGSK